MMIVIKLMEDRSRTSRAFRSRFIRFFSSFLQILCMEINPLAQINFTTHFDQGNLSSVYVRNHRRWNFTPARRESTGLINFSRDY